MNGMELSERFYQSVRDDFARSFPEVSGRAAAGLVGEGSECFGFDDESSRDHDWGPRFAIWVSDEDYEASGEDLKAWYAALPKDFMGYRKETESPEGLSREGVMTCGSFYARYIGSAEGPDTNLQWLSLPESYLAVVTNGKVFEDPTGTFTKTREKLLAFYPEDVRIKKIAARAAKMAQSGQYNYPRCTKRGEAVAAFSALAEFTESCVSMVYLLNRKYMPFYKWAHRGMERLRILPVVRLQLQELVTERSTGRREVLIEQISESVLGELVRQQLCDPGDSFLIAHCGEMMSRIRDPEIRALHVMAG